jgi:hypothetical protein
MKGKVFLQGLVVVVCLLMLSVPSVMAQGETGDCFGNFDCDQDVDANDVSNFLSSVGRSPFFNPCPLCQDSLCPCSSTVPKTGQTTSYATGDDGDLEKGLIWPNPRFTDNLDGTITDNLTNLIWLKDANYFGQRTWNNALSDCNGLADPACGLSDDSDAGDWRLPNRFELESLFDVEYYNPALPDTAGTGQWSEGDPFTNLQLHVYWSSTTFAYSTAYAWLVWMVPGDSSTYVKANPNYVWPVRDPL